MMWFNIPYTIPYRTLIPHGIKNILKMKFRHLMMVANYRTTSRV